MIQHSIDYLNSTAIEESLKHDPYWPKWNSPWWHAALLYEMGLAQRIPEKAAQLLLDSILKHHHPFFLKNEIPNGSDPIRNIPCPCQVGNIYQILSSTGIDLDKKAPWMRPWLLRYQMDDGGLSCDQDAYLATPQASSIVGMIAPLEAILFYTNREFTEPEKIFLDRGAECLIRRELRLGCTTEHNLEEQQDEDDWLKLCFPRFYLYDVLRGLHFVVHWAEKRRKKLPIKKLEVVISHLSRLSQKGPLKTARHCYEGKRTFERQSTGEWIKPMPASFFTLLESTSKIGEESPFLTEQWKKTEQLLAKLSLTQ